MCPDSKLLSAFFDGEVSSPWKEQIEDHLVNCAACRETVEGFAEQSRLLHSLPEPVCTPDFAGMEHLIRQRNTVTESSSFWSEMKWPALPLAAAAAAVLAFFFGFLTAHTTVPAGSYITPNMAVSEGWSIPPGDLTVPGEDINALLSILEPSDSQLFTQETSMDLPVDLNLDFYGDSQLLKTVSLNGSASR